MKSLDILQQLEPEFQYRELKGQELRAERLEQEQRDRIEAENQQFLTRLSTLATDKERARASYNAAVARGQAVCIGTSLILLAFMLIPDLNRWAESKLKLYEWTTTTSQSVQASESVTTSESTSESVQTSTQTTAERNQIVAIAKSWIGKDYKPGQSARCADFVRRVFNDAGFTIPITRNTIDGRQWRVTYATANSFFGEDVGTFIQNQEDWQPGDLIGFRNTYGFWGPRAITHVGILIEKRNGVWHMIDRGTSSAPIHFRAITHFGQNRIGPVIRPRLQPTT